MFDDIQSDALRCPLCGSEMAWQSKDGPCTLETLTVHELMDYSAKPEIYSDCKDCNVWVEVKVVRRSTRTEAQKLQCAKEQDIIKARKLFWGTKYPLGEGEAE